MSGPLPQHRTPTRATDEVIGTKTVVDKVHPGRKGERPTYSFKEVPVYRHKLTAKPSDPVSKHAKGKGRGQREHLMAVKIRKQVQEALAWMQANDKGWAEAAEAGLIPNEVLKGMGLLGGQAS